MAAAPKKDPTPEAGHHVNAYVLCLPLSAAMQAKLQQVRTELQEKHKLPAAFTAPSSFTLLQCHAYESSESRLLERLKQIAAGLQPVTLVLRNFVPVETTAIRVEVVNRHVFADISKALKPLSSLLKVPGQEPHFIKDPELLLAQSLKPFQFISLWMDCEHKAFTGQSVADKMLLLKKGEGGFQELAQLPFMNRKMQVRQGDLFSQF